MKLKSFYVIIRTLLLAAILACLGGAAFLDRSAHAQTPDAFIKISRIDPIIGIMEQSAVDPSARKKPSSSPGAMIEGMLQGTAWIDPSRSIIIGVAFSQMQPQIFVFIPFAKPNKNFQSSYNAVKGADYYVVPLSSGRQPSSVNPEMLAALETASRAQADALIEVKIEIKRLLDGRYDQLRQLINDTPLSPPNSQTPQEIMLKPGEIRITLLNLLAKARQLENITATIDFDEQMFKTALKARAIKGTAMAQLFASGRQQSHLKNYHPESHIRFRSRAFDVKGMLDLLDACFGRIYTQLGVDFKSISKISAYFTGESAGGISYRRNQMMLEMISQLSDPKSSVNFAEAIYLPWFLEYNRNIGRIIETRSGGRIKPQCSRILDSTLDGHKVVGVKGQWPVMDAGNNIAAMKYRMRITTVDSFLVIAPNDNRMKALIQKVKTLEKKPVGKTPLMTTTVDLKGYLAALNRLNPKRSGAIPLPRDMGAIQITMNGDGLGASFRSSMRVKDIRPLAAYFSAQTVSNQRRVAVKSTQPKLEMKAPKQPSEPAAVTGHTAVRPRNADYWVRKGMICSTYGNDAAAVKYFEKALKLSPKRADIWFNQGISYGEIGDFVEAVMALNKALELGYPEGAGLYGRARIYLLADETERALEDIRHAAALGYDEAIEYLNKRCVE